MFSDNYISDKDAESRLAYTASRSSARSQPTQAAEETTTAPAQSAELSRQADGIPSSTNGDPIFHSNDYTGSYEHMILNGLNYLCAIPAVDIPHKNDTAFAQAKAKAAEEEAAELARATYRGYELLKDMEGNCMYFISGWWSYSFCYNTDVKQFHQLPPARGAPAYPPVEDESTPSYILGKFKKSKAPKGPQIDGKKSVRSDGMAELQVKGETRYLVQRLGGGTTCDLTGRERRIEVQFHCHPQSSDRIGWIKEVSTCSYLMVIYTPRLCHDVAFLPPHEYKANAITCREVVPEPDIPAWQSRQSLPPRKLLNPSSSSTSTRPIVAGIEVGAMNQVGKPGHRLEPPNMIVQPNGVVEILSMSGKGIFLAKQEKGGKVEMVSEEEIQKLGLDPKEVAAVSQKLKDVAGGKAWKLEAYEGPDGLKLSGILQDESPPTEGEEGYAEPEEDEMYEGSEEIFRDEL